MEVFFTVLMMIVVVSLSSITTRITSFNLPLPLLQIASGAILAWPDFGLHVDFNPELFLVIFIPPLLFADGWKTSTSEFLHYNREIIVLALVLVFITVIAIGYLIFWIVPNISLMASFTLAAVLSPTDAVALSGIIGKAQIPKKIMSILQGEALMNDASGLISLKFSIAIAMGTMIFSFWHVVIEFIKVSIGGIFIGTAVCYLFGKSLQLFSRIIDDDPVVQIILLLLLPFASYLLAEHFYTSGILAAVSAGMAITRSQIMIQAPLTMRLRSNSVWNMLEFVFNGMVFLMLGLQLPAILKISILKHQNISNTSLMVLFINVFCIYIALIILRFFWLWIMQKFSKKFLKYRPMEFSNYSLRELLIASFGGVRGAITLAGVLSIPNYEETFSDRDKLVFLATGVILLSLIVGMFVLPKILKGIITNKLIYNHEMEFARTFMAEKAIKSLHKLELLMSKNSSKYFDQELIKEISAKIIGEIRRRADKKQDIKKIAFEENIERKFRLTALHAERKTVYLLRANRKISHETMLKLLHDLDLIETLFLKIE